MNLIPSLLFSNAIWSLKKELKFASLTFLMVLSLPFLILLTITQTGNEDISNSLAEHNTESHVIRLFYPNGTLYKEVSLKVSMPVKGIITNEFGEAQLPYYVSHTGIDIAGKRGDPVTPFMPGKVIYAGEIFWGFGKHVIVDHGNNITSIYGHLDSIAVKKDQEVKPSAILGREGSTGWSTGNHLHFQINVFGIPINPRVFMQF